MLKPAYEHRKKQRIPAAVNVFKGDDGRWFIQAVDEAFDITMRHDLPEAFENLSHEKRNYWLNRGVVLLAKKMASAVAEKIKTRENDHGSKQRSESDLKSSVGPGSVGFADSGGRLGVLPT